MEFGKQCAALSLQVNLLRACPVSSVLLESELSASTRTCLEFVFADTEDEILSFLDQLCVKYVHNYFKTKLCPLYGLENFIFKQYKTPLHLPCPSPDLDR